MPVPLKFTVCGDPVALSATLTFALSAPLAVGLKVTVIVHCALAVRLEPQAFFCENELALVPAIDTATPVSVAFPVFFSVIAWVVASDTPTVVLANAARVAGVRLTTGSGATPMPERLTFCGDPLALSATLT